NPMEFGPVDYLSLDPRNRTVIAEFIGLPLNPTVTCAAYMEQFFQGMRGEPEHSDVAVRTDADGNPIRGGDDNHAFIAIDFTVTGDGGRQLQNARLIECWLKPPADAMLVFIYSTTWDRYDEWLPTVETLKQGVSWPDE